MRVAVALVCLAAVEAHADEAMPPASSPALEVAGTWSGNSIEPKNGWRAALLLPVSNTELQHSPGNVVLALIARFDDHGAPAEDGLAETNATSLGGGLRATTTWGSYYRFGVFAEGTLGRTRARHADQMTSERDSHYMLSGGLVGGTRTLQVVADFGWLFTDAGDGRIGPIASLGLHFALD